MNNLQATKALDIIFGDTSKSFSNKSCILIDGDWGIGKTHFIDNYFKKNEAKYELIYISVFGKDCVKDIEKAVLIHSIPGLAKIMEGNGFNKTAHKLAKDLVNKFLGINIENYVNAFSIEDIKWDTINNKRIIICFDDIERKSDTVEMKNLLGLIERASRNFDVLIIGNSNEISESDINIFGKYKEKVIDHEIKIHEIDGSIYNSILESTGIENKDDIINVYKNGNMAFGENERFLEKNINNLRVFIKYVELIRRLEKQLNIGKLDKNIIEICKAVIYDHYFHKDRRVRNFDNSRIYTAINKILLNEDIKNDEFRDYFVANSEVRKDINSIYNAHRLNEREFEDLIKKVKSNIYNKKLEYFIKQENVISLVSALSEVGVLNKDNGNKLLEIAVDLYTPEKYKQYEQINYSDWDNIGEVGNVIECSKIIKTFIEKVNQRCKKALETYINNQIEDAKSTQNYEVMLKLLKSNELNQFEDFQDIFDYYFNQLVENYSDEVAEKIDNLINKTNSHIIRDFFSNRAKAEIQITKKKKYEYFNDTLDRKMQHEDYAEYLEKNPPEENDYSE